MSDAVSEDLSALAWVHGELRRSLETANKALRRYLKEAEAARGSDVDAVDPAVLRTARSQLHQGVGALELVGMPAVADVLRAAEAAVQRMVARPAVVDAAAVATVERVSFALLDFLARQLAGKPVSPVLLFPQYRAALQLAGADRVHPADLWKIDWQWRELPPDPSATPRNADDAARGEMETLVLAQMRLAADDPGRAVLAHISDLCADLGAGARASAGQRLQGAAGGGSGTQAATFWQLAAAVFEAQATGLLQTDVYSKRLASRLLAQLRMRMKGQDDISDRLAQDLLFFCSHARAPVPPAAPRLRAVRQAWRLDGLPTADYDSQRLGRFDPAVMALARKRVAAAKDSWAAVAGGEMHRLTGLTEQFVLVGESLQKLLPAGEVLAQALQTAVLQTVASDAPPPPALAMEVATGILYLDASLEDGEFDHPELAGRVQHLARRIDDVRIGAEPQPLDVWMEELYRRVSDRQTMGSVVQELRASLSEIEKQIDQYFRDPSQRQLLIPVPAQLSAMRGVLSVLGLEQASAAALHMRDDVDALAQTEVDPARAIQAGTFDRLADNLGALSFLIDMLAVQPQLAKSLFRYDPDTGNFSAVMGQTERVSAFAAFDEGPAPATAAATTPAGQPALLEQLQGVADQAALPHVSDGDIAAQLEPLAHRAEATGQPDLAGLLVQAQQLLRGDDPASTPEVRAEVRAQLAHSVAALLPPAPPALPPAAPVPPPAPQPAVPGSSGLEDDAEMREIFIEEAREVIHDAHAALQRLADTPDDAGDMTAVRRAFHTLKGSARMVGLREFGDAGWACEQLYNARLAEAPRMDTPLRQFSTDALDYMAGWAEAIAAGHGSGDGGGYSAAAVALAADALRDGGARVALVPPPAAASAAPPASEPVAEIHLPPSTGGSGGEAVLDSAAHPVTVVLPHSTGPAPVSAGLLDLHFDPPADEVDGAAAPPSEPAPPPPPDLGLPDWPVLPELPPEDTDGTAPDLDLPLGDRLPPDATPAPLPDAAAPEPADDTAAPPALPIPAGAAEELPFDLDLGGFADLPLEASDAAASPATQTLPASTAADAEAEEPDAEEPGAEPDSADTAALRPAPSTLGELADALEALPDLPPLPAPVDQPLDEVQPELPAGEALEIDLAELDQAFADAPALAAAPLGLSDFSSEPIAELPPLPVPPPAAETPPAADAEAGDDEQVKAIGPLRISIPLFNIYLNEADELSRRLGTALAEWTHEVQRHAVPETCIVLAHSLAGSSATVGYAELSGLARALEHALERSRSQGPGRATEPELFNDAADEIRRLLHQFAAGFLRPVPPALLERLAAHERWPVAPALVVDDEPDSLEDDSAAVPGDHIDAELFPIFEEEADELLPQLHERLRDWADRPAEPDAPMACMRTLHTIKGGARLAGAMRLGELAHRLETGIEHLAQRGGATLPEIEGLLADADAMTAAFEQLRGRPAPVLPAAPLVPPATAVQPAAETGVLPVVLPAADLALDFDLDTPAEPVAPAPPSLDAGMETTAVVVPDSAVAQPPPAPPPPSPPPPPAPAAAAVHIDWRRFATADGGTATAAPDEPAAVPGTAAGAVVRVRAALLDRMVNQAGEVSITRARIDSDVKVLHNALGELTDSLERMRRQLRDLELQAETQIGSRMEAAKAAAQAFDPLEMDRFTRFQELTRFMAESVNDVATLQRSLQRTLQSTEDELAAQARLTRELQDDLLRTRMVEFDSMADRLHRTVRQAARDSAKQVKLEIVGGAIDIDRGVLERMVGPFEHLLRNSVAHGIESPEVRANAKKEVAGTVTVTVAQAGNEVAVDIHDDGAGLDLARIRQRGVERGLLAPDAHPTDDMLAQLIFQAGFSTADSVTELAGRGVGLDVVRAEVNAMGGRIQTTTEAGRGTRFRLLLPLTTAVTQVVMLRAGDLQVAVPSTLVEVVRRAPSADVERAYADGSFPYDGEALPFFWLPALLQPHTNGGAARGSVQGRTQTLVVIRSAAQRVALHVDEVPGNQEVVVKNVGPQLSRLPGLAGVTLLPSGAVALIYNPVALASLYGDAAHAGMRQLQGAPDGAMAAGQADAASAVATDAHRTPLVVVVDDSLTVRRVTQRLLLREGYRVVTAKDGLDALEKLAAERPVVLLSDIEMPRMDGFDLLRNVRADTRLAGLPVVMITSRIAQKHRDYAAQLGADHYLGKPYAEDELLALVALYAGQTALA